MVPMQVSDEVIWATISSAVVGFSVRFVGWLMERKNQEDEQDETRYSNYHKSIEEELKALWIENRRLREEADKYRGLYLEVLETIHLKYPLDAKLPDES